MLTKDDVNQIAQLLEPIKKDINSIKGELEKHTKQLIDHSKLLRTLKKDQDSMLKMLDKEQMDQRKRLTHIEKQLTLPS